MIELPQRCFIGRVNPRWFARMRPLYINYTGSETLSNFQVKFTLTSSDIPFNKIRPDERDLLFVDENNNVIPHWIESSNGSQIEMWLCFPEIRTGRSVFFLYFGNPSFLSGEDGSLVFDFFTDFENLSGWEDYQSAWSHVTNQGHDNNAAYGDKEVDDNNLFQYENSMPSDPRVYESRVKVEQLGYADPENWDSFGMFIASGPNDQTPSLSLTITRGMGLRLVVVRSDGVRSTDQQNLAPVSTGTWYILGILLDGSNTKAFLDYEEKTSVTDSNANFSPRYFAFNAYDSSGWVDWARVRKYTAVYPVIET